MSSRARLITIAIVLILLVVLFLFLLPDAIGSGALSPATAR